MLQIYREITFSASHQLRGYKGQCERLHGHNWKVRVHLQAEQLDHLGMVMDFHDLDDIMREVISDFDHRHLNDVEPFETINPSSENLARVIFERTKKLLNDDRVGLSCCEVWENDRSCARYFP